MVKDVLDESSFDAGPGHAVPGKLGGAVAGVVGKLRDRADARHHDEDAGHEVPQTSTHRPVGTSAGRASPFRPGGG